METEPDFRKYDSPEAAKKVWDDYIKEFNPFQIEKALKIVDTMQRHTSEALDFALEKISRMSPFALKRHMDWRE